MKKYKITAVQKIDGETVVDFMTTSDNIVALLKRYRKYVRDMYDESGGIYAKYYENPVKISLSIRSGDISTIYNEEHIDALMYNLGVYL